MKNLIILNVLAICASIALGILSYNVIELLVDKYQPRPEPPIIKVLASDLSDLDDLFNPYKV